MRLALTVARTLVFALLLSSCSSPPALLLLDPYPQAGEEYAQTVLVETTAELALLDAAGLLSFPIRVAQIVDEVPGGSADCGADHPELAEGQPRTSSVIAVAEGYTVTVTAANSQVDPDVAPLVVVCDFDPDGTLLVADVLTTTGTVRSVGNDYITRIGSISGRVDVGIPDEAVLALQRFSERALAIPLPTALRTVRFHALQGGTSEGGFDIGEVTFLDAQGQDVTAASVPIPDVVHGVPRNRGSGVED